MEATDGLEGAGAVSRRSAGRVDTPICNLTVGCSRIGSLLNPTPLDETRRMLKVAADAGINVFDTANIYGQGDSERELGRLFAKRDDIFIVTKGGYTFSRKVLLMARLKPLLRPVVRLAGLREKASAARGSAVSRDFSAPALMASLEGSLRRLRREAVDAYLLHDPTTANLAEDAPWPTLRSAKKAGKIRYIGVSIEAGEDLDAVADLADCDLVQAPLDVLADRRNTPAYRRLVEAGTAIFVREVLRARAAGYQPDRPVSVSRALGAARALPGVASVLVGLSTRSHLRALLDKA